MRLVVITQRVDPEDPALGATVAKLRALAARDAGLPANVRIKSIGARNQLLRGLRLITTLVPELRGGDVAVLEHMSPI